MYPESHDSDQSISEEEDLIADNSENCSISFSRRPVGNKWRNMQVLSQLELLKRDNASDAVISSPKVEDEIEFPVFDIHDDSAHRVRLASAFDLDEEITYYEELASNSHEEVVSHKEKVCRSNFGSAKRDTKGDTWSEANKEANALVQLNENKGFSLPIGGRSKAKNKFLFRFQSHKEYFPLVANVEEIGMPLNDLRHDKELQGCVNRDEHKSMDEFLQDSNRKQVEHSENRELAFGGANYNDFNVHSVVELLDSLQGKSDLLQGNPEMQNRLKGRRRQPVLNRRVSPLGDRNTDEDCLLDQSSSEDEAINPKSVLQERTMAEQFQDAFAGVTPKNLNPDAVFHRSSGIGLSQKLQHVILSEKEREIEFFKKSQMDANSRDERGCVDVRILSRSLEAKLTVCCCALIGNEELFQLVNNFGGQELGGERIMTVIFSTRACGDVQLEIGNLVRIHPPWKEVAINAKDEVILLSTYFFQI